MSRSNQTLPPTSKRRQQARASGHAAVSSQLTGAAVLLVGTACLCCGHLGIGLFQRIAQTAWSDDSLVARGIDGPTMVQTLTTIIQLLVTSLAPFLLVCFLAAVAGRMAQVGFLWVPNRLIPRADRVWAVHRIGNLFTPATCFDGLRLILASSVVLGLTAWSLWQHRVAIAQSAHSPGEYAMTCVVRLGVCLLGLGALDYAVQWFRFEHGLRMSPEEVRAEVRAISPNPEIAAGRQHQRQRFTDARSEPTD